MGEVFAGRYELIDMIGEGGMGAVWRVRDRKRDRIIAAKVLRQSDAGSLLRFMREQSMRIHHPNVVTPLGWAGEDDQVLFTMPIVEGGSVATLMGDFGALPPRYATELTRQLLTALAAVHDAGVVHRDVKPANLLLDATGTERPHLWLTDFGVAVAVDAPRLTSLSVVMGTPGYLAPEQLRGADPDPRADLYAAGMVGFQMLTGHRPRPQLRSDRLDLPPRRPDIPESLWDLMTRLSDPDPGGRPQTAHDALRELQGPETAWVAQRDVEVFRQMPDLQGVSEGDFLRPGDPGAGTAAYGAGPGQPPVGEPTAAYAAGPGTAALSGQPGGAPYGRPTSASSTAAPRQTSPRGTGPFAVLVAAPLLAALAIALLVWAPWSSAGPQPGEVTGSANIGGICRWQDVGSFEPDADGTRLQCVYDNGRYVWRR